MNRVKLVLKIVYITLLPVKNCHPKCDIFSVSHLDALNWNIIVADIYICLTFKLRKWWMLCKSYIYGGLLIGKIFSGKVWADLVADRNGGLHDQPILSINLRL